MVWIRSCGVTVHSISTFFSENHRFCGSTIFMPSFTHTHTLRITGLTKWPNTKELEYPSISAVMDRLLPHKWRSNMRTEYHHIPIRDKRSNLLEKPTDLCGWLDSDASKSKNVAQSREWHALYAIWRNGEWQTHRCDFTAAHKYRETISPFTWRCNSI